MKNKGIDMENDILKGSAVRIRRGWSGGRTGTVIVCEHHKSPASSYTVLKVKLDGSGQVINVNSMDDLTLLPAPSIDKVTL